MKAGRFIFSLPFGAVVCGLIERLFRLKRRLPLFSLIGDIILKEGPITVERYMDIVLQHPVHGYYRTGDPIGQGRDFGTAPEVSQMFGEIIGFWCLDTWQKMGKPDPFVLLELGPGHGTLLNDFLRFTEPEADFHKALKLHLLESNGTLRGFQRERLEKYSPVHLETLAQIPALPMIVVANEFFDNIPARQFVKGAEGWRETLVDFKEGDLVLALGEQTHALPSDALEPQILDKQKEGWVYETSPQSRLIMKHLAAHVVKHGGAGLVIDYGHVFPTGAGTLDAWRHSRPTNILAFPGKTDVTADVDFFALYHAAQGAGARVLEPVGQGEFLARNGIGARAEFLKKNASRKSRKNIDRALRKLLFPSWMGETWKVMAFWGK